MTKEEFDTLQAGDRFATDVYTFVVEQDPVRAALCYRRESDSYRYPMSIGIIGTHTWMLPRPVLANEAMHLARIACEEQKVASRNAVIDAQNEAIKVLRAQVAEQAREIVAGMITPDKIHLKFTVGFDKGGEPDATMVRVGVHFLPKAIADELSERRIEVATHLARIAELEGQLLALQTPKDATLELHPNLLAVAAMTRTGR